MEINSPNFKHPFIASIKLISHQQPLSPLSSRLNREKKPIRSIFMLGQFSNPDRNERNLIPRSRLLSQQLHRSLNDAPPSLEEGSVYTSGTSNECLLSTSINHSDRFHPDQRTPSARVPIPFRSMIPRTASPFPHSSPLIGYE